MTQEEITESGREYLIQYADNEKEFSCLKAKFSQLTKAMNELVSGVDDKNKNVDRQLDQAEIALNRINQNDVNRFRQILTHRKDLESYLRAHDYGHMVKN